VAGGQALGVGYLAADKDCLSAQDREPAARRAICKKIRDPYTRRAGNHTIFGLDDARATKEIHVAVAGSDPKR